MARSTAITVFREAPTGARVVKAFSKYQARCEGILDQEHVIPVGAWVDVGIEWDAIDQATAQENWSAIHIAVSVDGQEIVSPKQYTIGPHTVQIECPERTRTGYAMALQMIVPPLSPGDHQVRWIITFERDLSDGWDRYPQVETIEVTSTLHALAALATNA